MKMKEILEKDTSQLRHELADQQKHLFELRSQAVTETLEDPSQLGKTRKVIARMMTALRQREMRGEDVNGKPGGDDAAAGGEGAGKGERKTTRPGGAKKPSRRTRK